MRVKRTYIPLIGSLIIAFRLLHKGNHDFDSRFSKVPYWKRNTTKWQQFKINARVNYRRFDTQTRGVGLVLIMLVGAMILIQIIQDFGWWLSERLKDNSYRQALDKFCADKQFYTYNFQACENRGVRPLQ